MNWLEVEKKNQGGNHMPKKPTLVNPAKLKLIQELKKLSQQKKARIWKRVAEEIRKGKREVNLDRINKYTKENEQALIPGKVLGEGNLDHKVKVAAFKFSSSAEKKIKDSGGQTFSIQELMKKNPQGGGIKILG